MASPSHPPSFWRALRAWAGRPLRSNLERAAFILGFALLVAVRLPRILLEGRFWAEEGQIFFENAWNMPWLQALLVSYAGYLNLTANLAGVLARHLAPLELAPYVSTGLALIIQCLPPLLLLTSRQDWLQHRWVAAGALLLIATPPASQEVWLNSICSQYHLALAAGIVLALETRAGLVGALQILVLFLAPLSSPMSWLLLPLFLLRAWLERSRGRTLQAMIMLAGVATQLAFFYTQIPGRHLGIPPSLLGAIVLAKHVVIPFLPHPLEMAAAGSLARQFSEAGGPLWPLTVVSLLFLVATGAAILHPKRAPLWFLLAGTLIAGGTYIGSLGEKAGALIVFAGGRYAFAPQALFGLAILSWGVVHQGRARLVARWLVVWLLVVALWGCYPLSPPKVQDGPPWRPEVQKWRQNPNYHLKIWPPGWIMHLPHRG